MESFAVNKNIANAMLGVKLVRIGVSLLSGVSNYAPKRGQHTASTALLVIGRAPENLRLEVYEIKRVRPLDLMADKKELISVSGPRLH